MENRVRYVTSYLQSLGSAVIHTVAKACHEVSQIGLVFESGLKWEIGPGMRYKNASRFLAR